jgi:hypothetical protein
MKIGCFVRSVFFVVISLTISLIGCFVRSMFFVVISLTISLMVDEIRMNLRLAHCR